MSDDEDRKETQQPIEEKGIDRIGKDKQSMHLMAGRPSTHIFIIYLRHLVCLPPYPAISISCPRGLSDPTKYQDLGPFILAPSNPNV